MTIERRDVLQDAALGMVSAFIPLQRGERGKLDVTMPWGEATIRWRGPDQLGISDQSVLFAVLEIALQQWRDDGQLALVGTDDAHWKLLEHEQDIFVPKVIRVVTSYRRLSLLCGRGDGGAALTQIRLSLRRLAEVTVWVTRGQQVGSSRLLGWHLGDDQQVVLVLSGRLTQALQGISYARISMWERAQLRTEAAMALHAALSCMVNVGRAWSWALDKLQRYISRDVLVKGPNRRKRHSKLRDALTAIGELPAWTVQVEGDIVRVTRSRTSAPTGTSKRLRLDTTGISGTPRNNGHEISENRVHPEDRKSSNDAGFQLVDASALIKRTP
jgi:hypothetical protein